jgi:hypothetical protein
VLGNAPSLIPQVWPVAILAQIAIQMLFSTNRSIKVDKRLYDALADVAQRDGYSSTDELIRHVLERAVADTDRDLDAKRAEEQLRGLGYLE